MVKVSDPKKFFCTPDSYQRLIGRHQPTQPLLIRNVIWVIKISSQFSETFAGRQSCVSSCSCKYWRILSSVDTCNNGLQNGWVEVGWEETRWRQPPKLEYNSFTLFQHHLTTLTFSCFLHWSDGLIWDAVIHAILKDRSFGLACEGKLVADSAAGIRSCSSLSVCYKLLLPFFSEWKKARELLLSLTVLFSKLRACKIWIFCFSPICNESICRQTRLSLTLRIHLRQLSLTFSFLQLSTTRVLCPKLYKEAGWVHREGLTYLILVRNQISNGKTDSDWYRTKMP